MKTPTILDRILDPMQWDSVIALLTIGMSEQDALEFVLSVFLQRYGEPDARIEPISAPVALAN